ncbi:MAG: glycosyltransferase [Phycisphaerae bacterium]
MANAEYEHPFAIRHSPFAIHSNTLSLFAIRHSPFTRTLIVSWHWPPTNRASAGVLGALFSSAPPGVFRVVTRSFPKQRVVDRREAGDDFETRVPPTFVPWPIDDQAQPRPRDFLTVLRTVSRMIRVACAVGRDFNARRVLAVYPHRLSLLAGWLTARRLRLPLVLYMHDLLAEAVTFKNPLRRAWWKLIDRFCLKRAWMVVVPTQEFADHYRRRGITRCWILPHTTPAGPRPTDSGCPMSFGHGGHDDIRSYRPGDAARRRSSPPPPPKEVGHPSKEAGHPSKEVGHPSKEAGHPTTDRSGAPADRSSKQDVLHIMYAGAIYEPHADAAQAFIAATESLDSVRVTFLTDPAACRGRLESVGARWLPHQDAMKELARADVFVVLLGSKTPCPDEVHGCFPSKLIDYLTAAKPVLAIVPQGCFVDRLVSRTACGVVVRGTGVSDIRAAIEQLRDRNRRREMSRAAARLAAQLRSETWMNRLMVRLREGPTPETHRFEKVEG